jgi:hypothetical protein
VPVCASNKRIGVEFGDAARLSRISKGLAGGGQVAAVVCIAFFNCRMPFDVVEYVMNYLAAFIADQLQHIRDLQIGQTLNQEGEKEHAQDQHESDEKTRDGWRCHRAIPIHPGETEEGIDECRHENAKRMKKYAIAPKPDHPAGGNRRWH